MKLDSGKVKSSSMRMSLWLLFFGAMGTCLAFMAWAQSNEEIQKRRLETTLSNLREALGVKVQEAEDKLQHLLTELKTILPKEAWSELKSVQARWEEFKHKDCAWKRQLFQEGSVAPIVYGRCLETHIVERIENLKLLLCEGYGMTGPCDASQRY